VADIRGLIEDLYQTTFPMDFAAVLASPVEFHPLATDAATGQSTDLRPLIGNPAELRLALRASAALPLLAGPPVEFGGRRFYDAGVSESVPYRTALAQGATHLLILRSRRDPRSQPDGHRPSHSDPSSRSDRPSRSDHSPRPSRSSRLLARTTLRRETPALRATFLARESRLAADDLLLAQYEGDPKHTPAVLSIRPAPDSPEVSRLATDGALLRAALEAGRAAALAAITGATTGSDANPGGLAGPRNPQALPKSPAIVNSVTTAARRSHPPGRRRSRGGPTGCRSRRRRAAWPGTRWLPPPR
jgi:predicted acylesterase/phospholipase RssA